MATYKVHMKTVGNPDFGQYAPISEPRWIFGETLEQLRKNVRKYLQDWTVGGANFLNPPVYRDGKRIGYFSYHLKLWKSAPHKVDYSEELSDADFAERYYYGSSY